MKIKQFFTILTISGVVTLTSCNKEEQVSEPSYKSGTITLSDFGNSHNDKLEYVGDNSTDLANSTMDDRLQVANAYSDPVFGNSSNTTLAQAQDGVDYLDTVLNNLSDAGDILQADGYVDTMTAYYNDLGQLFSDAQDSANSKSDYFTPSQFAIDIDDIIDEIEANHTLHWNSTNLTGHNAARTVATMEIAKASYAYWYNACLDNSTSPWAGYMEQFYKSDGFFSRLWTGIKRTAVDVFSFPSCPYCGGYDQYGNWTPYNMGDAWGYAGDQSAAVD